MRYRLRLTESEIERTIPWSLDPAQRHLQTRVDPALSDGPPLLLVALSPDCFLGAPGCFLEAAGLGVARYDAVMALIDCPECGREISSSAASCPNCGYPLRGLPSRRCPECGGVAEAAGYVSMRGDQTSMAPESQPPRGSETVTGRDDPPSDHNTTGSRVKR